MRKYIKVFFIFFKIGLLTIGGGLAMIPIMQEEFVTKNKWIEEEDITDIFAVCQSLPGVIAVNSSIYIGYRLMGIIGAIVSTIGVVLPSFIIIFIIYLFFTPEIANNIYLQKAFMGINAGITALIFSVTISMSKKSIYDIFGIILCIISFLMVFIFKVDIAIIVIISAFLGYAYYKIRKERS